MVLLFRKIVSQPIIVSSENAELFIVRFKKIVLSQPNEFVIINVADALL